MGLIGIFKAAIQHSLTREEAISLIGLPEDFENETLKRNYLSLYVEHFRDRSAAVTIDEAEQLAREIQRINEAYCILHESEIQGKGDLQLDFRDHTLPTADQLRKRDDLPKYDNFIDDLLNSDKQGLAFRLLELGITNYLNGVKNRKPFNLTDGLHLLGKSMLQMGMINQGLEYYTFGKPDFEKGLIYKQIGDYQGGLIYFGNELRRDKTEIPPDEVCQKIAVCYFLLNDYKNALNVVENILPTLLPKKQIFETHCKSKDFATAMMISIYKVDKMAGRKFDYIKLRVKYPFSFKYLQNCYGRISQAFRVIHEFETNGEKYDEFLRSLKPDPIVRPKIDTHYEIEDLQQSYFDLYEQSLRKSLIYHPK